jgi:hypothetical protein
MLFSKDRHRNLSHVRYTAQKCLSENLLLFMCGLHIIHVQQYVILIQLKLSSEYCILVNDQGSNYKSWDYNTWTPEN